MWRILEYFSNKFFPVKIKNLLLFGLVWFMSGFIMGTGTLMGPVRWAVNFGKAYGFSPSIENLAVKMIIIFFGLASLICSLWITKIIIYSGRKLKFGLPAALLILMIITIWAWMNPQLMQISGENISTEISGGAEFIFGPYPDEARMFEMKEMGYKAVISLLHPAVVPFEPKLLAEEQEILKRIGIEFIHLPMLPWISGNEESMEKIKNLAKNGFGKYYVHCYLGKDRVNVVKRVIQLISGKILSVNKSSHRKIEEIQKFERGKIIKLENGVYLAPYPTDEEFISFILNGWFKQVVSLLNPQNPMDTMWINKEEKIMSINHMPYELIPIEIEPYDADNVLAIINKIKSLPRPVFIHAFLTRGPQAEAFISSYKTGLPSLPADLFQRYMLNGPAELTAQNILIGFRPRRDEFKEYLFKKGIRNVAYIDPGWSSTEQIDRKFALEAGLEWKNIDLNFLHSDEIRKGETWYVYGIPVGRIKAELITNKKLQAKL